MVHVNQVSQLPCAQLSSRSLWEQEAVSLGSQTADDPPATPQALRQLAAARQDHLKMHGMELSGSVGTGWSEQKAKADARRKKESVHQRRAASLRST